MNVHPPNMDEAADLKSITLLGLDSSSFKLLSSCSKNVTVFPGEELLDRVGGEGEAILSLRLLQASLLLLERSAEELSFLKNIEFTPKKTNTLHSYNTYVGCVLRPESFDKTPL